MSEIMVGFGGANNVSRLMEAMPVVRVHTIGEEVGHNLTRNFLGLGGDESGRPLLLQELSKYVSIGSAMDLMNPIHGIGNH